MVLRSAVRGGLLPVLVFLFIAAEIAGQSKSLTVDDLYSYEGWTKYNGSTSAAMTWVPDGGPWLDDTHYLWPAPDSSGASWLRVEAATGISRPLFNSGQLESALVSAGAAADAARTEARRRPSNFNAKRDAVLLTVSDDLY